MKWLDGKQAARSLFWSTMILDKWNEFSSQCQTTSFSFHSTRIITLTRTNRTKIYFIVNFFMGLSSSFLFRWKKRKADSWKWKKSLLRKTKNDWRYKFYYQNNIIPFLLQGRGKLRWYSVHLHGVCHSMVVSLVLWIGGG